MRYTLVLAAVLTVAGCAPSIGSGSMAAMITAQQDRFDHGPPRSSRAPTFVAPTHSGDAWKEVADSTLSARSFERAAPASLIRFQVVETSGMRPQDRIKYLRNEVILAHVTNVSRIATLERGAFFTWRSIKPNTMTGTHVGGAAVVVSVPGSRGELQGLCYGEFSSPDGSGDADEVLALTRLCETISLDEPPIGARSLLD